MLNNSNKGFIDPTSPTWCYIKSHLEDLLSEARLLNDSWMKNEVATARLRGRIELLKELQLLDKVFKKREHKEDDEIF